MSNDNLVLISGESGTGKSMCLRNLKDPEGVMYLNCEAGKKLPFRSKFMKGPTGSVGFTITDPLQIYQAFDHAESLPKCHTIIIDTATYMMDMYESVHVLTADPKKTMQAWGEYAQFFKKLMQNYAAKSTKNVIILAHAAEIEQADLSYKSVVKVKGSLMANGIESYFSTVIMTKKVDVKDLVENDLITVSDDEREDKFKYCFQTKPTKDDRIRAPLAMFERKERYIDNDAQLVLDRLHTYYAE
jgi:hypothetical protein